MPQRWNSATKCDRERRPALGLLGSHKDAQDDCHHDRHNFNLPLSQFQYLQHSIFTLTWRQCTFEDILCSKRFAVRTSVPVVRIVELVRNIRAVRARGSYTCGVGVATACKSSMTSPVIHLGDNKSVKIVRCVWNSRNSTGSSAVAVVLSRTKMVVIRGTWVSQLLLLTKVVVCKNLSYLPRCRLAVQVYWQC